MLSFTGSREVMDEDIPEQVAEEPTEAETENRDIIDHMIERMQQAQDARLAAERGDPPQRSGRAVGFFPVTLALATKLFNPATGHRKFSFAYCYNKNHYSTNTYHKNMNYISCYCQMNSLSTKNYTISIMADIHSDIIS